MNDLTLPSDWFCAGSHPKHYIMGIDPDIRQGGLRTALICSRGADAEGFGTLMQSCLPGEYSGRRVRLSAMARTEEVREWGGLWFRVDGPTSGESLSFDNMQDRPLQGTSDWKRYSVVLDVPDMAVAMAYGVLLAGAGRVWISDVHFEKVGEDVPSTDLRASRFTNRPSYPRNLDFSR